MIRVDSVTFKQLRALAAVAECGSITQAAAAVGLTPPAVHTQLRHLEEHFDCRLLVRSASGGARLTLQGRTVLAAAETIAATLNACGAHVQAQNEGREGLVILGVVSTGKYFAPRLVAQLRQTHPNIEVLLKVGNRDSVVGWLQDGSIDLAVMGRPPRAPAVASTVLGPHPHVLIASPDHPLAGLDRVPPDELLKETFLAREEGSGTRILMIRHLDRLGHGQPYKMIEQGSNETIKQAVMAGLGVALISRHTVTDELHSGRLVELRAEGLPIIRHWFLLQRTGVELGEAGERVKAFITAQNGAFLPV